MFEVIFSEMGLAGADFQEVGIVQKDLLTIPVAASTREGWKTGCPDQMRTQFTDRGSLHTFSEEKVSASVAA